MLAVESKPKSDPIDIDIEIDVTQISNEINDKLNLLRRTIVNTLLDIARQAWAVWDYFVAAAQKENSKRFIKKTKSLFKKWRESTGHPKIVEMAMNFYQWFQKLSPDCQEDVLDLDKWSFSALNQLLNVPEDIARYLIKEGKNGVKHTVKSIECRVAGGCGKKYLELGNRVEAIDWQLVHEKLEPISDEELEAIKNQGVKLAQKAQRPLCEATGQVEPWTDDLIEALKELGYDASQLLKPEKKQYTKSQYQELEDRLAQQQQRQQQLKQRYEEKLSQQKQEIQQGYEKELAKKNQQLQKSEAENRELRQKLAQSATNSAATEATLNDKEDLQRLEQSYQSTIDALAQKHGNELDILEQSYKRMLEQQQKEHIQQLEQQQEKHIQQLELQHEQHVKDIAELREKFEQLQKNYLGALTTNNGNRLSPVGNGNGKMGDTTPKMSQKTILISNQNRTSLKKPSHPQVSVTTEATGTAHVDTIKAESLKNAALVEEDSHASITPKPGKTSKKDKKKKRQRFLSEIRKL